VLTKQQVVLDCDPVATDAAVRALIEHGTGDFFDAIHRFIETTLPYKNSHIIETRDKTGDTKAGLAQGSF
jgi:hypothetical protein